MARNRARYKRVSSRYSDADLANRSSAVRKQANLSFPVDLTTRGDDISLPVSCWQTKASGKRQSLRQLAPPPSHDSPQLPSYHMCHQDCQPRIPLVTILVGPFTDSLSVLPYVRDPLAGRNVGNIFFGRVALPGCILSASAAYLLLSQAHSLQHSADLWGSNTTNFDPTGLCADEHRTRCMACARS